MELIIYTWTLLFTWVAARPVTAATRVNRHTTAPSPPSPPPLPPTPTPCPRLSQLNCHRTSSRSNLRKTSLVHVASSSSALLSPPPPLPPAPAPAPPAPPFWQPRPPRKSRLRRDFPSFPVMAPHPPRAPAAPAPGSQGTRPLSSRRASPLSSAQRCQPQLSHSELQSDTDLLFTNGKYYLHMETIIYTVNSRVTQTCTQQQGLGTPRTPGSV